MTPELYNKEILGLAANMTHLERLSDPDVTATKTSRICGSKVTVDLKLEDGVVVGFAQEPKACALGQASCALAAELMEGQTRESCAKAAEQMAAMLKENGPPPEGAWQVFKIFEPARDISSRHASIMLPFDAVNEAFRKLDEDK